MSFSSSEVKYKILRLPEVKSVTGLSRSALYARIADNKFPKQISLGGRAVGWSEISVQTWIEKRIAESMEG